MFSLSAYSVQAASHRNQLQHRSWAGQRIGVRHRDVAGDEHLAAVDLPHDDRDVGFGQKLARRDADLLAQDIGLHAGRLHFADQRQRDDSVRPHDHVAADIGFTPEQHAKHILGSDDVIARHIHRDCGRSRSRPAGWRGLCATRRRLRGPRSWRCRLPGRRTLRCGLRGCRTLRRGSLRGPGQEQSDESQKRSSSHRLSSEEGESALAAEGAEDRRVRCRRGLVINANRCCFGFR